MARWDDVSTADFGVTVDQAIGAALNAVAAKAGLGPLHWQLAADLNQLEGLAQGGDYTDAGIEPVLQGWAELLGLDRVAAPMAGTVEHRGLVGMHTVLIWGVTDRAAWEAEPPAPGASASRGS